MLFGGGAASGQALNDTWELTGTSWKELRVAKIPQPRVDAVLAYSPQAHGLILFGGLTAAPPTPLSNSWILASSRV